MDDMELKRAPRQAPQESSRSSSNSFFDYTLRSGAIQALDTELAIVVAAADRQAAGYGLAFDDYTRLHQAHQFLICILGNLRGVEVTT
jgi:hypothetical protein